MEQWTGFAQNNESRSCHVPYFKHPCQIAQLEAWKKGEKFLEYTLAGAEKMIYDEYFFTKAPQQVLTLVSVRVYNPQRVYDDNKLMVCLVAPASFYFRLTAVQGHQS